MGQYDWMNKDAEWSVDDCYDEDGFTLPPPGFPTKAEQAEWEAAHPERAASSTGHRDSVMVVVGGGGPAE